MKLAVRSRALVAAPPALHEMDLSRFAFKREDRRDAVPEAAKRPRVEPPAKPVELPSKPDCSASAECSSANAECWLQELELIRHFRSGRRATVDDFHAFLLSLHGPAARFWALVACLLSVQCRDVVALETVKALMRTCPGGAVEVRDLPKEALESAVRRCNFCVTKADNVRRAAIAVVAAGVPCSYEALVELPGVGPKIANLMLSVAFGEADGDGAGIVVDTHVNRVARQLGWASGRGGAEATRHQLERWVPRGTWADFTTAVVGFGQLVQRGAAWRAEFAECIERAFGADSTQAVAAAVMVTKLTTS